MEHTVEKSCWGITIWAVLIVVGLVGLTTLVANPPHVESSAKDDASQSRVANTEVPSQISQ